MKFSSHKRQRNENNKTRNRLLSSRGSTKGDMQVTIADMDNLPAVL